MLCITSSIKSFCVTVHGVQTTFTAVGVLFVWCNDIAFKAVTIAPTELVPALELKSLTFINEACTDTPTLAPTIALAIAVPCPATSSKSAIAASSLNAECKFVIEALANSVCPMLIPVSTK